MSSEENEGGLVLAALVVIAAITMLPETLTYHASRIVGRPLEPSQRIIRDEVARAAEAYDIEPDVLEALVQVESAYQRTAESKVGARGLSQVMPFNAQRCGLHRDQLWDAVANVRCGALILREELDRVGNLRDALTVYNCGKVNCKEGKKYALKVEKLIADRILR